MLNISKVFEMPIFKETIKDVVEEIENIIDPDLHTKRLAEGKNEFPSILSERGEFMRRDNQTGKGIIRKIENCLFKVKGLTLSLVMTGLMAAWLGVTGII